MGPQELTPYTCMKLTCPIARQLYLQCLCTARRSQLWVEPRGLVTGVICTSAGSAAGPGSGRDGRRNRERKGVC